MEKTQIRPYFLSLVQATLCDLEGWLNSDEDRAQTGDGTLLTHSCLNIRLLHSWSASATKSRCVVFLPMIHVKS